MAVNLPEAKEYPLPTLQEFVTSRGPREEHPTAPYAHPVDRAIIDRLSRSTLQYPVNRFIELVLEYVFTPLLRNSVPVASRSFPVINELRVQAAATLGIPVPDVYAAQMPQLGSIFTAGTDEEAFIFVETTFDHLAPRDEMLFVIGHECGHIHNQHVTYHVMAQLLLMTGSDLLKGHPTLVIMAEVLKNFIGPALMAWSRRSEITADRAGLICCQNLEVAQRAFLRLVMGFARQSEVDIEDYLRTYREMPPLGTIGRMALMNMAHPVIPVRLQALQLFHDSELYYEVTGLERPNKPLLSRDELETRVGELIALI